eukprot:302323_1
MVTTEDPTDELFFEWYWWFGNVFFVGGSIIGLIIAIFHSRNVFLDLFTDNRTSISHRKSLPLITWTYKAISFCIVFSLYFFVINMIISELSNQRFMDNMCKFVAITVSLSYQLSKMFMYLVFIIRLHSVYNNTPYQYNGILLIMICVFIILISITINTLIIISVKTFYYSSNRHHYIVSCGAEIDEYIIFLIALYELTLAIGSVIAFIVPLQNVVKSIQSAETNYALKLKLKRLRNVGRKNAILTWMATLSTLLLMAALATGYLIVAPFDYVINMICMVLMTPYYKDSYYYNKICCGIIKCSGCCCICFCGDSKLNDECSLELDDGQIVTKTKSKASTDS